LANPVESLWTAGGDVSGLPKTALGESQTLLAAMIEQMPVALGLMNAKAQLILCNQRMRRYVPYFTMPSHDPATQFRWRALDRDEKLVPWDQWPSARALRGETVSPGMEFLFTDGDGHEIWTRVSAAPLLVVEGITQYAMAVVEDIDDLKRAEQQIKLIGRELEHRTNNILARVEAIINLTKADTVQDFFTAVQNRIGAMSRTDKLITKGRAATIGFKRLLEQELSPYSTWHDGGISMDGPDCLLGPEGAEALGMVFHELTTNAAKYGALSHAQGKLAVHWAHDGAGKMVITWSESGGKNVTIPTRRGFGTRVLDAIIRRQLLGAIDYQWKKEGMRCRFETRAERLGARFDA